MSKLTAAIHEGGVGTRRQRPGVCRRIRPPKTVDCAGRSLVGPHAVRVAHLRFDQLIGAKEKKQTPMAVARKGGPMKPAMEASLSQFE
jgi:hypothetical protein